MRQTFEFRVDEDFAHRLLRDDEGKKLGSVRLIRMSSDDPRLPLIGELEAEIHREFDRSFFYGWDIDYQYSREELIAAEAFKLWPTSTFEPSGEECGTIYDESTACTKCGAGATQVSDLRLDLRKVPKGKDIARTIAGEIIVTQRLAELLIDSGLKGFDLRPVRHEARYEDDPIDLSAVPGGLELLQKADAAGAPHPTGSFWVWLNRPQNRSLFDRAVAEYVAMKRRKGKSKGSVFQVWHQLIKTATVDLVAPTRVGINPFDDDAGGECRCPCGDTIGLNLLSELWLLRRDFTNCDIAHTKQYVGVRRGLLRPEQLLVISPRLWRALEQNKMKGFQVEVAHLH